MSSWNLPQHTKAQREKNNDPLLLFWCYDFSTQQLHTSGSQQQFNNQPASATQHSTTHRSSCIISRLATYTALCSVHFLCAYLGLCQPHRLSVFQRVALSFRQPSRVDSRSSVVQNGPGTTVPRYSVLRLRSNTLQVSTVFPTTCDYSIVVICYHRCPPLPPSRNTITTTTNHKQCTTTVCASNGNRCHVTGSKPQSQTVRRPDGKHGLALGSSISARESVAARCAVW